MFSNGFPLSCCCRQQDNDDTIDAEEEDYFEAIDKRVFCHLRFELQVLHTVILYFNFSRSSTLSSAIFQEGFLDVKCDNMYWNDVFLKPYLSNSVLFCMIWCMDVWNMKNGDIPCIRRSKILRLQTPDTSQPYMPAVYCQSSLKASTRETSRSCRMLAYLLVMAWWWTQRRWTCQVFFLIHLVVLEYCKL